MDIIYPKNMTLNCNGKIINFDDQKIMGILNVSDNSFYDGGNFNSIDKALSHVDKMINDGVDIIDLGGISSKPGSKIRRSRRINALLFWFSGECRINNFFRIEA